ncbi:PAS domain S-box protein [Candidatus Omnitrophota bacterium]
MKNKENTKAQLIEELESLKIRVHELETALCDNENALTSLKEHENKLNIMINTAPDIIYRLDSKGNILFINQAIESLGYTVEEIVGTSILNIIHPEDRDMAYYRINERRTGDRSTKNLEIRFQRKDLSTVCYEERSVGLEEESFFLISAEGLYDSPEIESPNFLGTLGLARDISERKKTERAIHESEEKYRTLFETMAQGIVYRDSDGLITSANPAAERILGLSIDQMQGRKSMDPRWKSVHEDGSDFPGDTYPSMVSLRSGKEVRDILMGVFHPKNEEYCWIRVNAVPQFKPGKNKPFQVYTTFKDITEQKKAEDALLRTRYSINQALDSIYWINSGGEFVDVNDTVCKELGYSREELLTMSVKDIVSDNSPFYEKEIWPKRWEALKKEKSICFESKHKRKNGDIFPVEIVGNYVMFSRKEYVLAISRDISARKKLEKQYQHAQKMETVGRLAGGVAHDFNNLLTAIIGNAELAMMSLSPTDTSFNDISEIRVSADKASNLTSKLLAFSRQQLIKPHILNLNDTIIEMDKMFRRLIGEDIELVTLPSEDLWYVKVDHTQIEQVLSNIVVNARDAMPNGGKLTIETSNVILDGEYVKVEPSATAGDYVCFSVSDTGMGIDEETKSKIFEPFFTTKEKSKGTGLGLATCYGIVKQNNGHIRVYSEPGLGTTVKVYLPRTAGLHKCSLDSFSMVRITSGTEHVLVVEDEPSVCNMIVRILENGGYSVMKAINGEEALRIVEDHEPDINILVTDVVMPYMGGKELSKKLSGKYPAMKTLFMSGYTDNLIVNHGILEPDVAFIEKPFSSNEIALKVRQVLDK